MKGARGFRRGAGRPRVIGHRGVRRPGLVENTMPAFEAAAAEGADAVELDVRVCKTGELVLSHDPTLKRLTDGADTRALADLPLSEVRRVELAGGARIPVLSEVLAFARGRGLAVNVEMKRDAPSRNAVVAATARLLRSWDPAHSILVSSFDPGMLMTLRAIAPRVPVAVLVEPKWQRYSGPFARPIGAVAVHLERTLTFPSRLRAFEASGLIVNVWTINDAGEARDLAALGVDGLITDVPGEIREAIETRG